MAIARKLCTVFKRTPTNRKRRFAVFRLELKTNQFARLLMVDAHVEDPPHRRTHFTALTLNAEKLIRTRANVTKLSHFYSLNMMNA